MKHGDTGKSAKVDPLDPYGEYMRVLEHLSLRDEDKCVERLNVFFEDVLQDSPVVIRVKETTHDLETLIKFMDHFKTNANIRTEF